MKKISAICLVVTAVISLTACDNQAKPSQEKTKTHVRFTDPRDGLVIIRPNRQDRGDRSMFTQGLSKVCDGPNLIYLSRADQGGGVAVSPNDAQCAAPVS
jgi:hypothetical protein